MSLSNTTQFNYMIIILLVVQNLRLFQVILQSALLLIGSKLKAASPELKALKPGKQVRCSHNFGHIKFFVQLQPLQHWQQEYTELLGDGYGETFIVRPPHCKWILSKQQQTFSYSLISICYARTWAQSFVGCNGRGGNLKLFLSAR